jgi:MFS family permease
MNVTTEPSARKRSDRPNLILGICCMSLLLVSMDVTIVNVALPAIQHELHATLSGLQWILDAYTLVVASLLMLAGWIGLMQPGAKYWRPHCLPCHSRPGRLYAQSCGLIHHCQLLPRT